MDVLLARIASSRNASAAQAPPASVDVDQIEAELPFEVLERRRQYGGWHASTHVKQATLGSVTAPARLKPPTMAAEHDHPPDSDKAAAAESHKRANKNRPVEQSSKKPVPRLREVVQVKNKKGLDPRFSSPADEAGQQQEKDKWRQRYAFVFDELLPQEQQEIKAQLARTKNAERKTALQQQLRQVQGKLQAERERRKQMERQDKIKAVQKEAAKAGKTPYYPKRSELRRLELLEKYKELKASGKLEKYMERKRKRNAAKDRKLVPTARQ